MEMTEIFKLVTNLLKDLCVYIIYSGSKDWEYLFSSLCLTRKLCKSHILKLVY